MESNHVLVFFVILNGISTSTLYILFESLQDVADKIPVDNPTEAIDIFLLIRCVKYYCLSFYEIHMFCKYTKINSKNYYKIKTFFLL